MIVWLVRFVLTSLLMAAWRRWRQRRRIPPPPHRTL